MTDELDDLKEYIRETIGVRIDQLTTAFEEQNRTLRNIEIKTTTDIAEIKKDIHQLQIKTTEIEKENNALRESQKFKWRSHDEEQKRKAEEEAKKDLDSARMVNTFSLVVKLLWFIAALVITMISGFLWQIFINGGIKGLPV